MKKLKILLMSLLLITGLGLSTNHLTKAATIPVNVANYGATGNDTSDDTTAIQNAVNAASSTGREVDVPAGNYYINVDKGINLPSNTTLKFDTGARFIALPSANESYNVIKVWGVSNVNIIGSPTIIGERDSHLGTGGEHGMGISIRSASSVDVENAVINNCWGDGIYLGDMGGTFQLYNKDVTIKNVKLDNNRRQGISVISAVNLSIDSPTITNTNGTDPQSGIDFEPNNSSEYLQNVTVTNPIIQNNANHGIHFWLGFNSGSTNPISINIINSSGIINNTNGNFYYGGLGNVKGEIMVDGKDVWLNGPQIITNTSTTPTPTTTQQDPTPTQTASNGLQKQVNDLKSQNAKLSTQVTTLTNENTKLKKKLSSIQATLNS